MIASTTTALSAALRRMGWRLDRPLRVVAGGNSQVPWALLGVLEESVDQFELFMLNAPSGIPSRPGISYVTPFVGPGMRGAPDLAYLPARLSHVPALFRWRFVPDVVLLTVSSPQGNGAVSLGAEVNILPAAIDVCRATGGLVVAESRPDVPFTFGDAETTIADLDVVISVSAPKAAVRPAQTPSADVQSIGANVASRVTCGATLQMGIGLIPDAVVPRLTHLRRLGIWSEMVSDGVLDLEAAGALDPQREVVASFAAGSPRLMAWLHENHRVRMLRTVTVNDPGRIASNPAMTSINTALTVDLFDQANASHVGSRLHSGFGGQCDFVVGAMNSVGGQSLMALRSWHPRADVSSIVGLLEGPVTSFQHTAVITEQGVAEMIGWDAQTQARHLIDQAAHPSVREELWEESVGLGLDGSREAGRRALSQQA